MATRFDEGTKESRARWLVQLLGMPLHADLPPAIAAPPPLVHLARRGFESLDDATRAMGHGEMFRTEFTHGLMMQAVHTSCIRTEDRAEQTFCDDLDRVTPLRRKAMLCDVRTLGGEMGIEISAARARHQLHSVADPEDRQSALGGGFEERLVEGELLRRDEVELDTHRKRVVVWKIVTARKEQSVEGARDLFGIRLDRELDGKPTRAVDGVGVAAIDVVVVPAFAPTSTVVEAEWDPDSRSMHGTSIAICGMLPAWHR